jgi:hypothetical protein
VPDVVGRYNFIAELTALHSCPPNISLVVYYFLNADGFRAFARCQLPSGAPAFLTAPVVPAPFCLTWTLCLCSSGVYPGVSSNILGSI